MVGTEAGNARGRGDVAVDHITLMRNIDSRRMVLAQFIEVVPVRREAPLIQQAGVAHDQCRPRRCR